MKLAEELAKKENLKVVLMVETNLNMFMTLSQTCCPAQSFCILKQLNHSSSCIGYLKIENVVIAVGRLLRPLKHAKVYTGGYSSLNNETVLPQQIRNKMETFFLDETLMCLYLLFGDKKRSAIG
ncbi:hypothetical protein ACH5RR_015537 [Cinchona calisaya]|uniref:Uncharacterized protein n=1 Tax=Cinchona calisaya TaxID=153742 RepID=A0ABD2ZTU3_9GENT